MLLSFYVCAKQHSLHLYVRIIDVVYHNIVVYIIFIAFGVVFMYILRPFPCDLQSYSSFVAFSSRHQNHHQHLTM